MVNWLVLSARDRKDLCSIPATSTLHIGESSILYFFVCLYVQKITEEKSNLVLQR